MIYAKLRQKIKNSQDKADIVFISAAQVNKIDTRFSRPRRGRTSGPVLNLQHGHGRTAKAANRSPIPSDEAPMLPRLSRVGVGGVLTLEPRRQRNDSAGYP
jgi:hypothetical protein